MEEKRCNFLYGPVTDNCNDLPYQTEGSTSGSNVIHIADLNLTFMDTTSRARICLVLEAFIDEKPWTKVAIYEIDDIIPTYPPTSEASIGSSASTPMSSTSIYGLFILKCVLEQLLS